MLGALLINASEGSDLCKMIVARVKFTDFSSLMEIFMKGTSFADLRERPEDALEHQTLSYAFIHEYPDILEKGKKRLLKELTSHSSHGENDLA